MSRSSYYYKHQDKASFAYLKNRSTDDAILYLMHRVVQHLDKRSSNTARALLIDYSSAFNLMQPHVLIAKLNSMNVPNYLQLWILNFLTNRPQFVQTALERSDTLILSTGAPQGCALSATLFVLYTNDLQNNSDKTCIIKYADDTVVVGLVNEDDDSEYLKCISKLESWCDTNYLCLNVKKTKEMHWDFRKTSTPKTPVKLKNIDVETVQFYKYLGLYIDSSFSFAHHVNTVRKKVNKKMYFVRSMVKLHVDPHIIALFLTSQSFPC